MSDRESSRPGDETVLTLVPFDRAHAGALAGWVRSPAEAEAWASLSEVAVDSALLRRWHDEPGVVPYSLFEGDGLVGYGEVWLDEAGDEAELARIIVDPAARGRGIGRELARLLVGEARRFGFAEIWLRVAPGNAAALACYAAAGFARASDEEERAFNAGQPRAYVWMRLLSDL